MFSRSILMFLSFLYLFIVMSNLTVEKLYIYFIFLLIFAKLYFKFKTSFCLCVFVLLYLLLWCPVDIRDHEQGHVTKRVCACRGVRARVRCVTLCCSSC